MQGGVRMTLTAMANLRGAGGRSHEHEGGPAALRVLARGGCQVAFSTSMVRDARVPKPCSKYDGMAALDAREVLYWLVTVVGFVLHVRKEFLCVQQFGRFRR